MLWNFAFASAVCSLQSAVYSLQPEVAAAVIAARFVFISIVVFALSAFFSQSVLSSAALFTRSHRFVSEMLYPSTPHNPKH